MKYKIKKNSVQETLVIPLYGRKLCTERFPNLFKDEKAVELIGKLDYDFSELEKRSESLAYRFGALEVAMRENDLMTEIKDYLKSHPKAAVVNMGCGLDQTAENCDNGQCKIYNLDFSDVIKARNILIPETDRTKNIACDLNDHSWFDRIYDSNGVIFIAAGVFYYFKTEDMKKLFAAMEKRFAGGRICFDAANKRAVKIMLKTWVKEAGITSIKEYFSVSDVRKELSPWLPCSSVSSKGYMLGYNNLKDRSVPKLFRLLSKIGDGLMKMQIVRVDFGYRRKKDDNRRNTMNKITIKIEGMRCGMCEAHICNVIRKAVASAKKVTASRKRNEATFVSEIEIDKEALKKAIADTGYTVLSVSSESYKKLGLFGR